MDARPYGVGHAHRGHRGAPLVSYHTIAAGCAECQNSTSNRAVGRQEQGVRALLNSSFQILVVEDDVVIADMLRELLAGAGYRVHWAPDVISALSTLERLAIDLITLDIELGTYSGRGLLALLKSDPRTRSIPVIVVSSCQVGPDTRRLAEHVLSKPFSIGPLLQLIGTSLGREAGRYEPWRETVSDESLELEVAHEVLD